MKKVSVIMSAYNAEKYIKRAIDSIINQTYKNIELVIVEDKSTDSTLDIIKSYTKNCSSIEIRLLEHSENKGAGWSRFDGIKACSGYYTTFLDSDDWLDNNCIETLVNVAEELDVDIVTPGYKEVTSKSFKVKRPKKKIILEGKNKFYNDPSDTCRFLNTNLIKANLWQEVEYSKRRFCEDSPTLIKLISKAKKRCILNYAGYNYYQNENSLIHTASRYKSLIYSMLCLLDSSEVFGNITTMYALPYQLEQIAKLKDKTGIDGEEINEILIKINNIVKNILTK